MLCLLFLWRRVRLLRERPLFDSRSATGDCGLASRVLAASTSIFISAFENNVYFNAHDASGAKLREAGFPCAQGFGPVDPATADGVIYSGQSLIYPTTLLSDKKQAWAAMEANGS